MKKVAYVNLIILLLFTISPLFAQENTQIRGTVSAPFLEQASIHIINSTQGTGTVNSDSGSYQILIRENDELLFSSVQYKNITILITSEIIKRGILNVILEEDLNVLAEVNISNINLTGNIVTDISKIEVLDNLPLNISFDNIKDITFKGNINDRQEAPRNRAFESNTIMKSGVNFLALPGAIMAVMSIKEKPAPRVKIGRTKTSNEQLKQLFQEDFFIETLKIKKEYIEDFIYYSVGHGLGDMIEKSNKLALMEFLIVQSKNYKLRLDKIN